MDDQGSTPNELTMEQLAKVIELVQAAGGQVKTGFTTREYCEAIGVSSRAGGKGYRDALADLTRLMKAGLLESGVPLKRQDVHRRSTTTLGWRVTQRPDEHPPQSEGEDRLP